MIACRPINFAALMILGACGPHAAPDVPPIPPAPASRALALGAAIAAEPRILAAPEPACGSDADCGYDPDRARCAADPRANRQPPIRDQGIVCYCDDLARRCATLRVLPVPCESDASCAVRLDPRPHPVAADVAHPHPRGRACRDFTRSATCERTNICTMHTLACAGGKR